MHVNELFSLKGQVAIVSGGGRGLGRHIAECLAEAGANIVVCSRKLEDCQKVSEQLKSKDVESIALKCDVTSQDDIKKVVNETINHFGQINILVNNSGATWGAPFLQMPKGKWEKVMDVNATGTFLFSQAVTGHMIERNQGKIINIASIMGMIGSEEGVQDSIGYSASKGAVIAFTKDLGVKLAPNNIQVNAIAPGWFPTKMTEGFLEEKGSKFLENIPARRFGSDHDLKGVALLLASKASDFLVGQTIVVDGGQMSV